MQSDHRIQTNLIVRQLVETDFVVDCFMAVEQNTLFVLIDMNDQFYREEAEESQFPVKLVGYSAKVAFKQQFGRADDSCSLNHSKIAKFTAKDKQ